MSRIVPHPAVLLTCLTVLLAGCVGPPGGDRSEPGLYDRLRAASVEVIVDGRLAGSGFFVDNKGLVTTAAHVVWPRSRCEVVVHDGRRLEAQVIAWDRAHDAALLQIQADEGDVWPALALAGRMPPAGSRVHLLGTPQFRHAVLITGHVARNEESFEYYGGGNTYLRCFHVSAPAPHGASGGCWVDERGRVVGLQSGVMRDGSAPSGIAFAAPVEAVARLVKTRQSAANATTDFAVEELWEQPTEFIASHAAHGEALVIKVVRDGGPGHAAGLKDRMLILEAAGRRVRLRDDFYNLLLRHQPGDVLKLRIVDAPGAEPRDVELTLGKLEHHD